MKPVTRHGYGRGTVWYVGTRLEPALLRALLDEVRAVEVALPEPLRDALAPRATAVVTRVGLAARGVAVLTDPGRDGGGGAVAV